MTERYYYNGSFINDRQDDACLSSIKVADRLNQYERRIEGAVRKLNKLKDDNEQLKKELAIYRKVASCSNCKYHNYDWHGDGDEFEVCDKGNDVTDRICEDWEEI